MSLHQPTLSLLRAALGSRLALALAAFFYCAAAHAEEPWELRTPAPYAIVIDAATGDVLAAQDADQSVPTASLSKLMTALLAFEALENGVIRLDAAYEVSEAAFRAGQTEIADDSLMWLNRGDAPTMDDLLRGLIIQSGNDAAIAIAEAVSGDETFFVRLMNAKAEELGLTNSRFANASGVDAADHRMSARDLALLTRHLIDEYPQYLHYYSELEFSWAGIRQESRNPLIGVYEGADGMKTGFTDNAGYGIVGTAVRDGRRIIVVLNGMDSIAQRSREVRRVLDWAFSRFEVIEVAAAGTVVGEAEVWLGAEATAPLALVEDLTMSLPRGVFPDEINAVIVYDGPVAAPVAEGQEIGELVVTVAGMEPRRARLAAAADVEEGGYFVRAEAAAGWLLAGMPSGGAAEAPAGEDAE